MKEVMGLITHEESQEVAKAFNRIPNHYFFSNDLKPCSGGIPSIHFQGDCFDQIDNMQKSIGIDFLGMHPDCTFLTNSGIRWLTSKKPREDYEWDDEYKIYINRERWAQMISACTHFKKCYQRLKEIRRGYIENPRMHPYALEIIGIPSTQIIHPYYFGSKQMKETHLWLVGVEPLKRISHLEPPKEKKQRLKWQNIWMASPGPNRKQQRSKTDPYIAKAMADQWG